MKTTIDTVFITPTAAMPIEVFRQCHELAFFVEHMERRGPNRIVWDSELVADYCPSVADAEYEAIKRRWIQVTMELPEAFVAQLGVPGSQAELFTRSGATP